MVEVIITGRHIEITQPLHDYVTKKLDRVNRYFEKILDIHVILEVIKKNHEVEIVIDVNGLTLRSKGSSPDMYASIDQAVDKTERQIKRYKEKITHHKPKSGQALKEAGLSVLSADEEGQKIIRSKKFTVKPMSVGEAIMQMDLLGYDFLVFTNQETDQANVAYHRKDGNYGLIET